VADVTDFWVVVGTAAPIIALANQVATALLACVPLHVVSARLGHAKPVHHAAGPRARDAGQSV
jgi:hypothetical protein